MALSLPLGGGPSDVRSGDRLCYALTGAKVITAPGRVIDPGVVVIRGGVFEAVGAQGQVLIPADARVFELKGKVLHAAFIDPYVPADRLAGRRPRGPSDDEEAAEQTPGGGRTAAATSPTPAAPANPAHPEDRVIDTLRIQERVADTYRRLGFAVVAAVPSSGILRGRGALVSLADESMEARVLASETGQYVSLEPGKDATLFVTDGDILDLRSHVVAAYLDGRALDLTDKQKRLYERYRNRPKPAAR
jgi:hypothetical protein